MRRSLLAALVGAVLATLLALAPSGGAATSTLTVSKVAAPLNGGLYYISPALRKEVKARDLQSVVVRHPGYRLVVLNRLPKGTETAETAANAILAKLKRAKPAVKFVGVAHVTDQGTDLGGAMAGSGTNATLIQEAAKNALAAKQASVVDTMKLFTDQVASGKLPNQATSGSKSKGGGGFPWVWLLVVAVLAIGVLLALRMRAVSRDRRKRARVGSIGTARSFHGTRLDKLSFRHSELVRAVGERPDDPALAEHHQTAGAKLVALRRQLPQLYSPRELRTCATELDLTEWHIECAEALAEGRGLPPQPSPDRPALCFFTHEHGLGTVEIDVTRPDGTVASIWVCPANAVALTRGEPLLVGQVHVGGRQVPWPTAPTYYGAAGWSPDDLPGLEYEGREIWGREAPFREDPIDVPPDAVPTVPPEAVLPPGVATPLPPGVTAPPLIDEDALPPGVSAPAEPPAATGDEVTGEREPPPAPAAAAPAEPASPNGAPRFEELDAPAHPALVRAVEDEDVTADHPTVDPDATQAYDPFAATDDELPPWERDDPNKRD
jgi:hypothetical protein